jgi:hypothetical protein
MRAKACRRVRDAILTALTAAPNPAVRVCSHRLARISTGPNPSNTGTAPFDAPPAATIRHHRRVQTQSSEGMGFLVQTPADMNPHQSQAFILDVSRGAGTGRVHDRYIISPPQVHDRLYQI